MIRRSIFIFYNFTLGYKDSFTPKLLEFELNYLAKRPTRFDRYLKNQNVILVLNYAGCTVISEHYPHDNGKAFER